MRLKHSIIVSLTLWLASPGVSAQDLSNWKCELCPFDAGQRAAYEAGATFVSDDAFRFGTATGFDDDGAYGILNASGQSLDDGLRFEWRAEDLALDKRSIAASISRQGRYELSVGYRELPVRRYDTTRTVFTPAAFSSLILPPGWTRAGLTSGLVDLDPSLTPKSIELDRSVFEIGGSYAARSDLKLWADYRQQRREGTDIVSGAWFTQANYLPRPVDTQTDEIDLGASYTLGSVDLTLAWYGSFFSNEALALSFDNPFRGLPGADRGQLARPPDNSYQQISVAGTWHLNTWRSVVAARIASGRGEQDDSLLPYTLNPTFGALPLPRSSLDGKVDTTDISLAWTARPNERMRVKASYRFDERDNATPRASWTRIITDSFNSGGGELNTPYSYERSRFEVGGRYELLDNLDLLGGFRRTELERDFQEVAEQTEDAGWASLRWKPLAWLNLRLRGGTEKRDIERYDDTVAQSFGQNPLLRKYNLAYRFREFGEITVSAALPETPFTVGAVFALADDSYSQSELGLRNSDEFRYAIDLSYSFAENASAYLTVGGEQIEATQLGSQSFSAADWMAMHDDDFSHFGAGLVVRDIAGKADLTLDFVHSDGDTDIAMSGPAVQAGTFPALASSLDSLRLSLDYELSERFELSVGARYEKFETRDWSLQSVDVDTLPTVLTLGATPWDYDVWVVGIGFRYVTGGGPIRFPE